GGLDDRKCALQGLVVVAGHLGDDERRVVRSNPAPGDLEGRWRAHGVILLRYRFETTSKPLPANSRCETALSVSTSASTKRIAGRLCTSQRSAAASSARPVPRPVCPGVR